MKKYKLFALSISALIVFGAAALTQERPDMRLADAGFKMREANTPQKLQRLRVLPPRIFVARTKGDRRYYIYADPDYCKCAFIGNAEALQSYRDMSKRVPQPDKVPSSGADPEGIMIQDIDDETFGSIIDDDILDYDF